MPPRPDLAVCFEIQRGECFQSSRLARRRLHTPRSFCGDSTAARRKGQTARGRGCCVSTSLTGPATCGGAFHGPQRLLPTQLSCTTHTSRPRAHVLPPSFPRSLGLSHPCVGGAPVDNDARECRQPRALLLLWGPRAETFFVSSIFFFHRPGRLATCATARRRRGSFPRGGPRGWSTLPPRPSGARRKDW